MNPTARIQPKGQVTIPTRLRAKAGLAKGDLVEFSLHRGKIVITPKVVIAPAELPTAEDEYTPAQRKIIDARLDEGMADYKAGRTFGPFDTHAEFLAALHKESAKLKKAKRSGR